MPGIDYQQLRRQLHMRQVLDLIGFQATGGEVLSFAAGVPFPAAAPLQVVRSPSTSHGRSFTASPAVLAVMPWISGQPSIAYPSIKLPWISVVSQTSICRG